MLLVLPQPVLVLPLQLHMLNQRLMQKQLKLLSGNDLFLQLLVLDIM
jgi:hypothetical protein